MLKKLKHLQKRLNLPVKIWNSITRKPGDYKQILVMKMILEITDQFLFCLVSLKCLKELCIRDAMITYCKTTYYIPNNLAFKRVIAQNTLQYNLLIKLIPALKKISLYQASLLIFLRNLIILVSKIGNYRVNGNNLRWS